MFEKRKNQKNKNDYLRKIYFKYSKKRFYEKKKTYIQDKIY